jgi:26S proteasome regulatory subunit N3
MVTTRSSKTKVSEKKDETSKKDEEMEVEKSEEDKALEKRQLIVEDIRAQFKELEKAASQKEPRQVAKIIRQLPKTRRQLDTDVLGELLSTVSFDRKEKILKILNPSISQTDDAKNVVVEVELYIALLVVIYLLDQKRYDEVKELADGLIIKIGHNVGQRKALDPLNAKIYFYHSRVYELMNRLQDVRPIYMKRLRTTALHGEFESESVLLNLMLRNFLHYNLFEQAEKLISKSSFPEQANNNEWARYLYYTGRIKAIQLEYSDAQKTITNALRKAPQISAIGFRQTATKLLTVVDLLLGDIPERARFTQKSLEISLRPYFELCQAVRQGNLSDFNKVVERHHKKFKEDKTITLILRLRHNVIKTGIRRISLAYSKISLSDIAEQLALDSPEDAEFIVAKAIRDGVIDAQIDHQAGTVTSHNKKDTYSTRDPEYAFDKRIKFCHNLHAQSVKAMRFPPRSYHDPLSAEERRQREQEDLELAKEMVDEDDDMF